MEKGAKWRRVSNDEGWKKLRDETIERECGAEGMKGVLLGDIKIIVP